MAYMVSTPVTSTSQALGMNFSLIMLISVQTLQPKFCCTEVQHWMAVASSALASIQSVEHHAQLGHLHQLLLGHARRRGVGA